MSTNKQGQNGLGVEAQRKAVRHYLVSHHGEQITEFVEVESGKRDDRPQLAAAKARGFKIGNPKQAETNRAKATEQAQALRPHIEAGRTPSSAIATDLNARGIPASARRPQQFKVSGA